MDFHSIEYTVVVLLILFFLFFFNLAYIETQFSFKQILHVFSFLNFWMKGLLLFLPQFFVDVLDSLVVLNGHFLNLVDIFIFMSIVQGQMFLDVFAYRVLCFFLVDCGLAW